MLSLGRNESKSLQPQSKSPGHTQDERLNPLNLGDIMIEEISQ